MQDSERGADATRRTLLGGFAAGAASFLAGCGGSSERRTTGDPTPTSDGTATRSTTDETAARPTTDGGEVPPSWTDDVDAGGHALTNLGALDADRVATRSRPASAVVWRDGETVYADGDDLLREGPDAASVVQDAVDAVAPGVVYVASAGSPYDLTSTIDLADGVHLTGPATLRRAHQGSVVDADGVSDWTVSDLTVLGNKAEYGDLSSLVVARDGATDWVVRNTTVRNGPAQGVHAGGFEAPVERGLVVGNTVTDCDHRNVICDPRVRHVRVVANTALRGKRANVLLGHGTRDVAVVGNLCRGGASLDSGIVVHNTASDVQVLGNTVESHVGYGMRLMANARDVRVGWNTVAENGKGGLILRGYDQDGVYDWQESGDTRRNVVARNHVRDNENFGIELRRHGESEFGASGNVVEENLVVGNAGAGVAEGAGASANVVRANVFRDNEGGPTAIVSPETTVADNVPARANARDVLPDPAVGRTVLASPAADPDGDGNGEWVVGDGEAWREAVDLPGFT